MKLFAIPVILLSSFYVGEMPSKFNESEKEPVSSESRILSLQPEPKEGIGKMRSIVFKSQEFCRAELKDFDFDVHFTIVSATVYFTGTNFKGVEKGTITSSSLKPIKHLMERCQPGSIVVFDEIKVKGPDNEIRTIDGVTYQLY